MGEEERFLWRHALICGLLWGVVVLMAVTLSQPIGDLQLSDLLTFVIALGVLWSCVGVIWALGAKLAEAARHPVLIITALLLVAWIVSVVLSVLTGANAPGNFGRLTRRMPVLDLSTYDLWVNLFYGGLYTLGYFMTRRAQRLRRRLAALRLARNEAEARLREARLRAVRGQIQPAMLLDALEALRHAYARDRFAGDRMFDLLISFLRAAMPGLRSGASTLAAELVIVHRYAALREALGAGAPVWRLTLAEPPVDLAFPPLRLLPALDRMSRSAPAGAAVEVRAGAEATAFVVRIAAPTPDPPSARVLERLRRAMRQDLGVGAMMADDPIGAVVAELYVTAPERRAVQPA